MTSGDLDRVVISTNDMEPRSVEINKDEALYLKNPFPDDTPVKMETMLLEISRLSLEGEEEGWKFFTGGNKAFIAEMLHDMILKKEISVHHGALIKAEVETRLSLSSAGTPKKIVTKVFTYNGEQIRAEKSGIQITLEKLMEATGSD